MVAVVELPSSLVPWNSSVSCSGSPRLPPPSLGLWGWGQGQGQCLRRLLVGTGKVWLLRMLLDIRIDLRRSRRFFFKRQFWFLLVLHSLEGEGSGS